MRNVLYDMILHVDASGGDGTKWLPHHWADFASGEPSKFTLLKTKDMFVKCHSFGRIIFQSYPMLEKHGANYVVEVLLYYYCSTC